MHHHVNQLESQDNLRARVLRSLWQMMLKYLGTPLQWVLELNYRRRLKSSRLLLFLMREKSSSLEHLSRKSLSIQILVLEDMMYRYTQHASLKISPYMMECLRSIFKDSIVLLARQLTLIDSQKQNFLSVKQVMDEQDSNSNFS